MKARKPDHVTRRAQTAPLEGFSRPAYFRAYRIPAGTLIEPHAHDWCQFAFARRGIMHVRVRTSTLIVPPQFGMWLPVNTPHSVWAAEDVDLESIYINAPAIVSTVLTCRVVMVSDLVRAFIHHLCSVIGETYDEHGKEGAMVQVLLDLLEALPDAPLNLPLPEDPKLRTMCEQIQQEPGNTLGVSDWAKTLHVSQRTLARHFLKETGMTLHHWRQRLRLLRSLELLKDGMSVTTVAFESGYSSTSAFIFAFRSLFGCPPKQFYATGRAEHGV
ncbi:helix-turn-helix transcriptional regulator [Caballeronia sp. LZ035]|uniref:AraC family transcriptional regulator n=1 Tax=Caballeronia sp. LZ035 TaxID=3038568 RepID=UPI002865A069|nr:helix-turn-helix transcriptional regulator [Caballeronia sp. LZ035]MDR5761407.1 helix-turn-helix transcriptional regulator [Caballeronia sp. LZ035]